MASQKTIREGYKLVKPVLSTNKLEAKRRVINLYKAWYRQIPFTGKNTKFSQVNPLRKVYF